MARPKYSKQTISAYRGFMSDLHQKLDVVYDFVRRSPKAKPDVAKTLMEFQAAAGIALVLPSAVATVSNAGSVPIGDATAVAAGQDNGTASVAANAITRVTLPGTDKIIKSTVKYTAPAITGTWVNGYTFTIVNGVITGIVAS